MIEPARSFPSFSGLILFKVYRLEQRFSQQRKDSHFILNKIQDYLIHIKDAQLNKKFQFYSANYIFHKKLCQILDKISAPDYYIFCKSHWIDTFFSGNLIQMSLQQNKACPAHSTFCTSYVGKIFIKS